MTTPRCTRLVGAAWWGPAGSAVNRLLGLRRQLAASHSACGVRVALLLRSGWLVVWAEGEAPAVTRLWERVVAAPALRGARVLHHSQGVATLQGRLQVASLHAGEPGTAVARHLYALDAMPPGGGREAAALWLALAGPSLSHAGEHSERQHLVLASWGGTQALDLLLAFAGRHHLPVAYQRFAEADERAADCGLAYVDFESASGPTRLHAVSRRAMGHELVRLALRAARSWVLPLGGSPAASCRVAEAVVPLLQDAQPRPAVHLLGNEAATLLLVGNLLRTVPGVRVGSELSPWPVDRLDDIAGLPARHPESAACAA